MADTTLPPGDGRELSPEPQIAAPFSKRSDDDRKQKVRFIRKKEVAARVGWHPSHLMRMVRAGKFPQPVQLGPNSIAFVEEEVTAWMEARVAARKTLQNEGAGDEPGAA